MVKVIKNNKFYCEKSIQSPIAMESRGDRRRDRKNGPRSAPGKEQNRNRRQRRQDDKGPKIILAKNPDRNAEFPSLPLSSAAGSAQKSDSPKRLTPSSAIPDLPSSNDKEGRHQRAVLVAN